MYDKLTLEAPKTTPLEKHWSLKKETTPPISLTPVMTLLRTVCAFEVLKCPTHYTVSRLLRDLLGFFSCVCLDLPLTKRYANSQIEKKLLVA